MTAVPSAGPVSYPLSMPRFAYWAVYLLFFLLMPVGFIVYFTEGQNTEQLLAIEAAAVVVPGILWLMLWGVEKFVRKVCTIEILPGEYLEIKNAKEQERHALDTIEQVEVSSFKGSAMRFWITLKNGERKHIMVGGTLRKADWQNLQQHLQDAGVRI